METEPETLSLKRLNQAGLGTAAIRGFRIPGSRVILRDDEWRCTGTLTYDPHFGAYVEGKEDKHLIEVGHELVVCEYKTNAEVGKFMEGKVYKMVA